MAMIVGTAGRPAVLLTKRQAMVRVIAVGPISWHQPRLMSMLAGSLAVEKVCSAALRRG